MNCGWAVGIDGGGTKTAALCKRAGASPLRRASAGPCNIAAMEPSIAAGQVKACLEALQIPALEVGSLCIGVAGYSAVNRRMQFIELLESEFRAATVAVVPDFEIAHFGAFPEGKGIVLIAGTGSIAYGVNPIGESAVVGGYGYLIDDAGTGYGLGRLMIAAAGRTFDGVSGSEALTEIFVRQTGIRTREHLIDAVYGGSLDRVAIAALAPLVSEAAAAGDREAASILMHAGGALARIAQAAITKLFNGLEPVSLAKIGSLWSAGGELNSVFERSLLRSCAAVSIVSPATSPVEGALSRAQKCLVD